VEPLSEEELERKRQVLVRNEQRKLRASFGNTLAGGVMTAGVAAPIVAWILGTLQTFPPSILFWFFLSIVIHLLAMDFVEGMEL
jgi:predicted membrane protein